MRDPGVFLLLTVIVLTVIIQAFGKYDGHIVAITLLLDRVLVLRIDNSGWSVNSSTLFDVAGMSWYQRKYHVLYIIRQPIINSIYGYI